MFKESVYKKKTVKSWEEIFLEKVYFWKFGEHNIHFIITPVVKPDDG